MYYRYYIKKNVKKRWHHIFHEVIRSWKIAVPKDM
jgi:hypothetical protein